MRTTLKSTVLIGLFCFTANVVLAQGKLSIDKVYKVTLRNSGPIISDEQIKGYYFFYMSDKIDKRTNEYTLQILDANLNKTKDIKFQDSKQIVLLESSFNGSSLVFLFYDDKENMLDYRVYDLEGKQTASYSKILDKRSEQYFKMILSQTGDDEESENQNVFDLPGKGYISVIPIRENKKYTYEVNYYSSEKKKSWNYNPVEDGKFQQAQYLGSNDSIAVIEVLSKDKLMSKNMESTLLGINLSNGRKVFEMRTQDGKRQLYPMNISSLNNGSSYLVMGPYYEGNDNIMKDKSDGLGVWEVDNRGKILRSKYNSWDKEIGKHLKIDQRGRVADLGYVFFHNVMQTEDGKIFAIGEGYKKAANAAGIALSVLTQSYGANMTKLVITDMLMLQMNENFDVSDAKIYEKGNNTFPINGADFASPHTLALAAKTYGIFDYAYTQMGKNKSSFVSAYTDYVRSKDYKGFTFNSISYADGKVTTDKINMKTSASRLRILPGKPGSVLIVEYFKKDKRLDLRLEKIN